MGVRWQGLGLAVALLGAACAGKYRSDGEDPGVGTPAPSGSSKSPSGVSTTSPNPGTGGSPNQRPNEASSGSSSAGSPTPPSGCKRASLDVTWEVVGECPKLDNYSSALHCAFDKQLNIPSYGPFVGCCPVEKPYACANSTPWQCFSSEQAAAESCGRECVACAPPPQM